MIKLLSARDKPEREGDREKEANCRHSYYRKQTGRVSDRLIDCQTDCLPVSLRRVHNP